MDHRQLPKNALVFSTVLIALAPLLNLFLKDAFTFISATATSMFLLIWSIMIVTHMTYRKKTPKNKLPTFRMPLYPISDIAVLRLLKKTNIFAKLSPIQKARIVRLLREARKCSSDIWEMASMTALLSQTQMLEYQ